ncbi:MAG: hypothetical protein DRN14_00030 [Thermoplasmata archaeon]|nr:MAG: hypothetical protein DRN14_00030 [Thermoplasmata archaeon]
MEQEKILDRVYGVVRRQTGGGEYLDVSSISGLAAYAMEKAQMFDRRHPYWAKEHQILRVARLTIEEV